MKIKSIGISLFLFLNACQDKNEKKRILPSQKKDLELSVVGSISNGEYTNKKIHTFQTAYYLPDKKTASIDLKPEVRFWLEDPTGKIIYDDRQDDQVAEWTVGFDGPEGIYKLSAELFTDDPDGDKISIKDWNAKVYLDISQPILQVQANLVTDINTGDRKLDARIKIENEKKILCENSYIKGHLDNQEKHQVVFGKKEITPKEETYLTFESTGAIPKTLEGPFQIIVNCIDPAGNKGSWIQPLSSASLDYTFHSFIDEEKGLPVEGGDSVVFVTTGEIEIKMDLRSIGSDTALASAITEREGPYLNYAITIENPSDYDNMPASGLLLEGPFTPTIIYRVPAGSNSSQEIYVTLFRTDQETGEKLVVGTIPIQFYVDNDTESIKWTMESKYTPAKKDTQIVSELVVENVGAPLKADPYIEYTTDGKEFVPANAKVEILDGKKETGKSYYLITLDYPFEKEKDFRLRARATDIMNQAIISPISPNLIGSEHLVIKNPTDRSSCVTANKTPGSHLVVHLASQNLCRPMNFDGSLGTAVYAQLILQNLGQAKISLYQTSFIEPSMSYRIIVDGKVVSTRRLTSPAEFSFEVDDTSVFQVEIDRQWLQGNRVEIEFDRESTSVHSIGNYCYNDEHYPKVTVQDRTFGIGLQDSAFPCHSHCNAP